MGEPEDVSDSNLVRIGVLISHLDDPSSDVLAGWLLEVASDHILTNRGECDGFCQDGEWPCLEWKKAERHAVSWLIAAYERAVSTGE